MSKDPRKEELKKAWKEQERKRLVDSIPMPHQDLRDLFDYLDRDDAPPCDHTLRETTSFLEQRGLDVDITIPWLCDLGGCCDCEVLCNVEEKFWGILDG